MYKYNDTIKMLKFIPAYCLVKNTGYRLYTVCSMSVCVCVCVCVYVYDQTDMQHNIWGGFIWVLGLLETER